MSTPTYSPQDAINLATKLNHNAPTDVELQAQACDMVNSLMWMRFPWDWTLQGITNISLTDTIQDYSLASGDNSVFYRFNWLEIGDTSTTPNVWRRLNEKSDLSVELVTKGGIDVIREFAWMGRLQKIRLAFAANVGSGQTLQLQGEIQKIPTKINGANLGTPLVWPDIYFPVYLEGVRYYFYQLTDDTKAGTVQANNGRSVYTGQLGKFMSAFDDMAKAEDFSNAEDLMYPSGGTLGVGKDTYVPRINW